MNFVLGAGATLLSLENELLCLLTKPIELGQRQAKLPIGCPTEMPEL